jgi:hypothetical protein
VKIDIPNNLMDNVENRLKQHIKDKRKKRYIHNAVAAIALLVILPTSTLVFAQYNDSIPYKQEIDLARENKNITEVNRTFNFKDVKVTIKEIVADDTGIEVIYDVSNPKYSIDKINFGDKDDKSFNSWGYSFPASYTTSDNKEKAFCIIMDNNAANYMHNNPVTIKIDSLTFNDDKTSDNIIDKVSSIFNNNNNLNVDWTLKMQIPMQQVKVIPVNKEYALDIGVLKINSLKIGVLKSILDYSFVPKDKTISNISPVFSVRLDNNYIISNSSFGCCINNSGSTPSNNTQFGVGQNTGIYGTQEFESIYYNKINEIGIKLIGVGATYHFSNVDIYKIDKIDKNKLPMEFAYNGEKIKITSIAQKGNSTIYTFQYDKTNRIYSEFDFLFSGPTESYLKNYGEKNNSEKIQYSDQVSRNAIYSSLVKKVPNLKDIENQPGNLQDGVVTTTVTVANATQFQIDGANKNFIYDEDEVIIHK